MPFPRTDIDLTAQGYEYESKTRCRGCGAEIEFWRTPKGKHMPLDPGTLEPHWAHCPKAEAFRK
jgi:hypothetical protein